MHEKDPRTRDTLIWSDNGCEDLIPAPNSSLSTSDYQVCAALQGSADHHWAAIKPFVLEDVASSWTFSTGSLSCLLPVLFTCCPSHQLKSRWDRFPSCRRWYPGSVMMGSPYFTIVCAYLPKVCDTLRSPIIHVILLGKCLFSPNCFQEGENVLSSED